MKLKLGILTLTHMFVDTYATSFSAMIYFIVPKLKLSLSILGVLISITSIAGSMNQLLFGYWSDKIKKGSFIVLGTAVAAIFLSFTALAPNVFILALLLIIGGSGVSAFHPQATAAAGRLYKDRRGLGLSVFITGGNVGLSVGPLIIAAIASNFGLESVVFWAIPGIIVSILSYFSLHKDEDRLYHPQQKLAFEVSRLQEFKANFKLLMILYAIVSLRAATSLSITNFIPLFLKSRGASAMNVGTAIFTFMISGTIGMTIGGYVSDRTSRKSVILFSLIFATPALYALLASHDIWFFILLFISGFILNSSLTINVAMAQELIPSSASLASALTMGVGWGTGGILVMFFGFVADHFSMDLALKAVAAIPILTSIFAFTLPAKIGNRQWANPKSKMGNL